MYRLSVRLMLIAALVELGMSLKNVTDCRGRECLRKFDWASYKVLKIDWKPMSVWPEEAKRLH